MAFNPSSSQKPLNLGDRDSSIVQPLIGCNFEEGVRKTLHEQSILAEKLYGLDLLYYKQDFDPKLAHPIYGDQNTPYIGPYLIKGLIKINSDTSLLSEFGIETTNDIDIQITYETWASVFGTRTPQAGDKFEIKDLLCERPSGFVRVGFEVVSQGDGSLFDVSGRWFISGQRSDFNWQEGEPKDVGGKTLMDSAVAGVIDDDTFKPIEGKSETNDTGRNLDEMADNDLQTKHSEVYGGFYMDEDDY